LKWLIKVTNYFKLPNFSGQNGDVISSPQSGSPVKIRVEQQQPQQQQQLSPLRDYRGVAKSEMDIVSI